MLKVINNVVEVKTENLAQALSELMILAHTIAVRNGSTLDEIFKMILDVNKHAKLSKDMIKFTK